MKKLERDVKLNQKKKKKEKKKKKNVSFDHLGELTYMFMCIKSVKKCISFLDEIFLTLCNILSKQNIHVFNVSWAQRERVVTTFFCENHFFAWFVIFFMYTSTVKII